MEYVEVLWKHNGLYECAIIHKADPLVVHIYIHELILEIFDYKELYKSEKLFLQNKKSSW